MSRSETVATPSLTATLPASPTLWLMATLLRPVSSVALDRLAACPREPPGGWPTPPARVGAPGAPGGGEREDLPRVGAGGGEGHQAPGQCWPFEGPSTNPRLN